MTLAGLRNKFQLIRNMGLRYVIFRVGHELKTKLGIEKIKYPVNPTKKVFISLEDWKAQDLFFGITANENFGDVNFKIPDVAPIFAGKIDFFSSLKLDLGKNYDWLSNPDSGYKYNSDDHWTMVNDYDRNVGDIKFVWEKSRFSYLYDVIRHDHFSQEDHSEWVFSEINSWLHSNKINCGPNYKCSQEISLRVLNWTYVLNYYKNSIHLTEELFQSIIHSIYWQLQHVYSNINFSRIAVRNNHALTETLALYLGGLFYPFFPESKLWKNKGKIWFEKEIDYQIYDDGTFLQFSVNYHRVVIQLLTWAIKTADYFEDCFSKNTYDKAYKSLKFLFSCQEESNGWLPNYGSNDGALFFKLNSCDFRDYRPQLNALHVLLTGDKLYNNGEWDEDIYWIKAKKIPLLQYPAISKEYGWTSFEIGGYYILRERETITFIRCGSHRDRPAQADNLHVDIWHQGKNVIFDGGSYKYNTDIATLKYYMGSESHNTIMLDDEDQMVKGPRFIWYNWSQALNVEVADTPDYYLFKGTISAFRNISPKIRHSRHIKKMKEKAEWIIEDVLMAKPAGSTINQRWHVTENVRLISKSQDGTIINVIQEEGERSDYYGRRESSKQLLAHTLTDSIITTINIQ